MNASRLRDSVLKELQLHVERAVRPVPIGLTRKMRIREELLTHLVSVYEEEYDEELARCGNKVHAEEQALHQALQRFGDPHVITQQLQQDVSVWDRLRSWDDRLLLQPGESFLHLFVRHLLASLAIYVLAILLMLGLLLDTGRLFELALALRLVLVVCVVMALFTSAFLWLFNRVGRALYGGPAQRSTWAAVRYGLMSLGIFPLLLILTYWGLGSLTPPAIALLVAAIAAPVAPLSLLLLARKATDEIRHEEWAQLNLDE